MQAGDEVGGYLLDERIPGGGMAEVWKARHVGDSRSVFVLKFLKPEFLSEPELRARFVQECDTQRKLRHENIVRAFHSIPDPPALVMQFVDGQNLAQIRAGNPEYFTAARIVEISRGVLAALQTAHDSGVCHRDVKPQNILIERSTGKPLLTDFGIALVQGRERLTQGAPFGSLPYMSPEQITSSSADNRSDIYSFGCVLYEMLTGVTPFSGHADQTKAHLEATAQTPRRRNPNAPAGFDLVVMTCLAKDPDARYGSCAEVMAQLDRIARAPQRETGSRTDFAAPAPPRPPEAPADPDATRKSARPLIPRRLLLPGTIAGVTAVALLALLFWYLSKTVVVRMYGSSSVGDELAPVLATAFLSTREGVTNSGCKDATHPYKGHPERMKDCSGDASLFRRKRVIQIYPPNSGVAFECLSAKSCEIGMASRRMKIDDRAKYPGLEDLFSRTSEHIIGLDGIAIVVPAGGPSISLTVDQVRRIFCRVNPRIAYWSDLGVGGLGSITTVIRNPGSGTRDFFAEKVCGGTTLAAVPEQDQLESLALVHKVAETPGAIGFVSSTLTMGVKVVPLAAGPGVAPLEPSEANIKSERYALTRRLYLYNNPGAPAEARELIDFATGDDGQRAAKAHNFVPLIAEAHDVRFPETEPPDLRRIAEGARQLDLSFHFDSGQASPRLDNFARDNIDRVRNYALKHTGTQFLVLGFADSQRSHKSGMGNIKLSLARARAVEVELEQIGIHPVFVEGFGEAMQINPGPTEAARQENRRAEVWVK